MMTGAEAIYMVKVWLQTAAMLLASGAAGGSIIWVFRNPQRPFLWLAAPLAGLSFLGGTVQILYYAFSTRLSTAVMVSWSGLVALTAVCLVRSGLKWSIGRKHLVAVFLVMIICSVWGVYVCNRTSIHAGEPTITVVEGSDMFGYAMVGDWLAHHTGAQHPRRDVAMETLQYANLFIEASRGTTFFLAATAGWIRGTTSLFSYDWFNGVVLAAAAMGFAGLFASRRTALYLLVAVALTTMWFTTARTGYLGKTLGYPGALMLVAFFLEAWSHPSTLKNWTACLFGPFAAFLVNPILPFLMLTLVCGGLLGSIILSWWWSRRQGGSGQNAKTVVREGVRALALWAGMALPSLVVHRISFTSGIPPYLLPWDFVIPVSLDLEAPALALVGKPWSAVLSAAFFLTAMILCWLALRGGQREALACLLCVGLIPLAFLLGQPGLYGFHGLIYPMVAAGVALLIAGGGVIWTPGLLLGLLVLLHVPQIWQSWKRYLPGKDGQSTAMAYRESDVKKLKKRIGRAEVDLCTSHFMESLLVLTELACFDVPVRLRSPAWDITLANWAKVAGCPPLPEWPPKARYSIKETRAFSPPGTKKMGFGRLKLCEDEKVITTVGVRIPTAVSSVVHGGGTPGYWLDTKPTGIEIHNGTGTPAPVIFKMLVQRNPQAGQVRELNFGMGSQRGKIPLAEDQDRSLVELPLQLPAGATVLELSIPEGSSGAGAVPVGMGAVQVTRLELEPRFPEERQQQ